MTNINFNKRINSLKGIGENRANLLQREFGIETIEHLLYFFPRRYIDRTKFYKICDLVSNSSEVQLVGKITGFREITQSRGKRLLAIFEDDTGVMELIWFRGYKWIRENLSLNTTYIVFGKINFFKGVYSIIHPEIELKSEFDKGLRTTIQPIYPSTEKLIKSGVSNKVICKLIEQIFFSCKGEFYESLSKTIINQFEMIGINEALLNIHFPRNQKLLSKSQFRLKFEELFFFQIQLIEKNLVRKSKIKGFIFKSVGDNFNFFYKNCLPFDLTNDQKLVIKQIRSDFASNAQMNRLLQGDVGSGKTIVAFMSMLIATDNNFQATLMAPTEILAIQHYNSLKNLSKDLKINVVLLTGSSTKSERKFIHQNLENGTTHILVGTHAILEDRVKFKNLGLAIIDEQHRFGVAQRSKLWHKNNLPPHVLVMTATPIPRTLAMSLYGDLDISLIKELPPGRKTIKTVHRLDKNRLSVFRFIREEINNGKQIYIVYPLIKESQKLDFKDLMDGYESISREFQMPDYQISIMHGQMKSSDKEYEMERFAKGETNIMVATTVIEVGVNVPNASVMIIESAERFGLSQLHQLRGRVGRGNDQSYCILMTKDNLSGDSKKRINTMVDSSDGFQIAEVDLKLRGPGDVMGTQQSGILNFKIANIVYDNDLLFKARESAKDILAIDPNLELEENYNIKKTYMGMKKRIGIWNYIS
ncbi:MAG: ATP-dependent DNA helicase RecG [Flavobacteriaceae bacterium]|nr:ATP-dependent DNA helicase RecG [Flavobacteriaceae bacterium]